MSDANRDFTVTSTTGRASNVYSKMALAYDIFRQNSEIPCLLGGTQIIRAGTAKKSAEPTRRLEEFS